MTTLRETANSSSLRSGRQEMLIAVTGASSFIGSHVLRQRRDRGMSVRAIARSARPGGARADGCFQIYDYPHEPDRLREALRGVDAVVHFAAFAHRSRRLATDPVQVNVAVTRAVFEAARDEGVTRFVNMSSIGAVMSHSSMPVTDATPLGTVSRYGQSKREAERYLAEAASDSRVLVTNLRPPAVYGRGMRGKTAMLFRLIASGVPLPIGGIDNARSFLFVILRRQSRWS